MEGFRIDLKIFLAWLSPTNTVNCQNVNIKLVLDRAGRSNLVLVRPSYQPYLESQAHKFLGGSGGMPPQEIFEN